MANSISSRRFVILSSDVTSSEDFFNRLVMVKDQQTGEVGTLLCAHMCHFSQQLIGSATWIEGCKTPEIYAEDTRLALGYHPDQYTQWKVYKETNEIEIYLTGSWSNPDYVENTDGDFYGDNDGDQWLHTGLTMPTESFVPNRNSRGVLNDNRHLFTPSLIRLFERILGSYVTQEKMDLLESTVHRLFNSGRISAWEATVLPWWMLTVVIPWELHWEGHPSMFLGEGLRAYIDGGTYPEFSIPDSVD